MTRHIIDERGITATPMSKRERLRQADATLCQTDVTLRQGDATLRQAGVPIEPRDLTSTLNNEAEPSDEACGLGASPDGSPGCWPEKLPRQKNQRRGSRPRRKFLVQMDNDGGHR